MIKYKKDDIIKGTITGIEDYGIFVKLDDNYNGLIHISEISESFVKNVSDYAKIGELVDGKIIEIDEEKHQIKLSIKRINHENNKKTKNKIIETKSGFKHLKLYLNTWIDKKLEEINKNN
ncbi:MAG: S1 RNA-binding domain-containing protein [Bacilli bacterium]|nr:S1 RNA-binding domain-containing protein [Bacilli bacterium]